MAHENDISAINNAIFSEIIHVILELSLVVSPKETCPSGIQNELMKLPTTSTK